MPLITEKQVFIFFYIYYHLQDWPLLVIVPSSLKAQWYEAFEKWIPDIDSTDIKMVSASKDEADRLINIVSYNLINNMAEKLLQRSIITISISFNMHLEFNCVICDESHYLKNWKSLRTKGFVSFTIHLCCNSDQSHN